MSAGVWTVLVDDNFHHGDEEERYRLGDYDSYEAAVSACRRVVDAFLASQSASDAEELWTMYARFGEDPWIRGEPPAGAERFSAWTYARARCACLCPTPSNQKSD